MDASTILYRPVAPKELKLIAESGYTTFPPRLSEQPIFYPVLNEEYAIKIARDWNAADANNGAGFVTMFEIRTEFISHYEVHQVGSSIHKEFWIPAADLAKLNADIVGKIKVIAEFLAKRKTPPCPEAFFVLRFPQFL
jgi:hypothetical protein